MSEQQVDSILSALRSMETKFEHRFEAVDNRFEAMEKRFDSLEIKFEVMETKFEKRFDAIEGRLVRIEADLDKIEMWTGYRADHRLPAVNGSKKKASA